VIESIDPPEFLEIEIDENAAMFGENAIVVFAKPRTSEAISHRWLG
jgi:hypothetical protein